MASVLEQVMGLTDKEAMESIESIEATLKDLYAERTELNKGNGFGN